MALEVEGRKNRDTHRLFSTLESTLGDAVKGMEARSVSPRYLKLFKLILKFDPARDKKLHNCKRNSHKIILWEFLLQLCDNYCHLARIFSLNCVWLAGWLTD